MQHNSSTIARIILLLSSRMMPEPDRHWAAAMQAELSHIDGILAQLCFSIGCLMVSVRQAFAALIFDQKIRTVLSAGFILWAAVKVYLWTVLPSVEWPSPDSEMLATDLILFTSFSYIGVAALLLGSRVMASTGLLLAPFIGNMILFMIALQSIHFAPGAAHAQVFWLAIVAEELLVWSIMLAALTILIGIPRILAERNG